MRDPAAENSSQSEDMTITPTIVTPEEVSNIDTKQAFKKLTDELNQSHLTIMKEK
jgi:hypothetical protein